MLDIDGYSSSAFEPSGVLGYSVTGRTSCQAGTLTDIRVTKMSRSFHIFDQELSKKNTNF